MRHSGAAEEAMEDITFSTFKGLLIGLALAAPLWLGIIELAKWVLA